MQAGEREKRNFNFSLHFPYNFIIRGDDSFYNSIKKDEKVILLSHLLNEGFHGRSALIQDFPGEA